jgi:hypothetical protein
MVTSSKHILGREQNDDWVFDGRKASQFVERYEIWADTNGTAEDQKCKTFALMVKPSLWERVTSLAGYKENDWPKFKTALVDKFWDGDLDTFLPSDLYELVLKVERSGKPASYSDIMKYYRKFSRISSYLVNRGHLEKHDETRLFLKGVDQTVVDKLEERASAKSAVETLGSSRASPTEPCPKRRSSRWPPVDDVVKDIRELFEAAHPYAGMGKKSGFLRDLLYDPYGEVDAETLTGAMNSDKTRKGRRSFKARRSAVVDSDSSESTDDDEDEVERMPRNTPRLGRLGSRKNKKQEKVAKGGSTDMDELARALKDLTVNQATVANSVRELAAATARGPPGRDRYEQRASGSGGPPPQFNSNRQGPPPQARGNDRPLPTGYRQTCLWCDAPGHRRRECAHFNLALQSGQVKFDGTRVLYQDGRPINPYMPGVGSAKNWFLTQQGKEPEGKEIQVKAAQLRWEDDESSEDDGQYHPASISIPRGSFAARLVVCDDESNAGTEADTYYNSDGEEDAFASYAAQKREREEEDAQAEARGDFKRRASPAAKNRLAGDGPLILKPNTKGFKKQEGDGAGPSSRFNPRGAGPSRDGGYSRTSPSPDGAIGAPHRQGFTGGPKRDGYTPPKVRDSSDTARRRYTPPPAMPEDAEDEIGASTQGPSGLTDKNDKNTARRNNNSDKMVIDVDDDDKPKPKRQAKTRLVKPLEERTDTTKVFEKFLDSPVPLSISEILATSPDLCKMILEQCKGKRVPLDSKFTTATIERPDQPFDSKYVSARGMVGTKGDRVLYSGTLATCVADINGGRCEAMVDGGSQISIMSDECRKRLGLPLRIDGKHYVRGVTGPKQRMCGICENVPVKIGGITVPIHFFISEKSNQDILLGQPFLVQVQATVEYGNDGTVTLMMHRDGKTVSLEVTSVEGGASYLTDMPVAPKQYNKKKTPFTPDDTISETDEEEQEANMQRIKAVGQWI